MSRIRNFVQAWIRPLNSTAAATKSRRARPKARPDLEAIEARLLLTGGADLADFRAQAGLPEVFQQARQRAVITEVRGSAIVRGRASLTAKLTTPDGAPIAGEILTFRLGPRVVGRATTGANGEATVRNIDVGQLRARNYVAKTVVVLERTPEFRRAVTRGPLTVSASASTLGGVTAVGTPDGTATFTANLTSPRGAVSGRSVQFFVEDRLVGAGITGNDGVATLSGVRVAGLNPGTYPIRARFAGDAGFGESSADGLLTIARSSATVSLTGLSRTYGQAANIQVATSPSNLPIAIRYTDAAGNPVANPTRAGSYNVVASIADPNYVGNASGTLVIALAPVSVTDLAATSKVYDGTTTATIDAGGSALSGVLPGDSVTLDAAASTATFASKGVGTDLLVTIAGLALTGPDASNYVLANSPATATASITPRTIQVDGLLVVDKAYDGTTVATISDETGPNLLGTIAGDDVSLGGVATGTFLDASAGVDKAVAIGGLTLTGPDAANYGIAPIAATATITPKVVGVSGITAVSRVYDGTDVATLDTTAAVVSGLIAGDDVTVDPLLSTGTFADRNVGANKAVTVDGLVLAGPDAANYQLTPTTTVTADITPAVLTINGLAAGKEYDGTTAATLNTSGATLAGVIAGDTVTFDAASAIATFADRNVGANKAISVGGLTLAGADAGNYTLAPPAITGTITARALAAIGIVVSDKVYDGTTVALIDTASSSLAGLIGGDDVTLDATLATGAFADANAGTNKAVTIAGLALVGADAGNYTLAPVSGSADITRATLTVTGITASDKVYDGTTNALIDTSGALVSGLVGGDDATVNLGAAVASFADRNVGANKAVTLAGVTLNGADASNYEVVIAPIAADITARALNVNGFTATNRAYDRTDTVAVGASGISFNAGDVVAGDDVSFVFASIASAVGTMADANAGNGKAVAISGLAITGADAGNYAIVATTTVDIARVTLTVSGIPDLSKNYDGNQYFVSINTSAAALNGIFPGDTVSLNTAGVFGVATSANVGTWTVFINGLALGGANAANYNLGTVTVNGTITGT